MSAATALPKRAIFDTPADPGAWIVTDADGAVWRVPRGRSRMGAPQAIYRSDRIVAARPWVLRAVRRAVQFDEPAAVMAGTTTDPPAKPRGRPPLKPRAAHRRATMITIYTNTRTAGILAAQSWRTSAPALLKAVDERRAWAKHARQYDSDARAFVEIDGRRLDESEVAAVELAASRAEAIAAAKAIINVA